MAIAADTENELGWPAAQSAWVGVAALMFAGMIGIVDRQVFNLVVDPIRGSLGFSDVQIGVLQGFAFTAFYFIVGFPIGWLVDRVHRLRLTGVAILLQGIGTLGCGLADSFNDMFIARVLIGTGDAIIGPAAVSLIADYFSPARRPTAMSVYGAYEMGGAGLSLLAGGAVLVAAETLQTWLTPATAGMEPWRFVFLTAAAPSLLGVLFLLAALEPPRRGAHVRGGDAVGRLKADFGDFLEFIVRARNWIGPHIFALSICASVSLGFLSWMPTILQRDYGWQTQDVGLLVGCLFLVVGPAGTLIGGRVVRAWQLRGMDDAALRAACFGILIVTLSVASLVLPVWTYWTILVPTSLAVFGTALTPMVSVVAIQRATPADLRGRVSSVYFVLTAMVSGNFGPLFPALLAQYVYSNSVRTGISLGTVALIAAPLAAGAIMLSLGPFRRLLADEPSAAAGNAVTATDVGD